MLFARYVGPVALVAALALAGQPARGQTTPPTVTPTPTPTPTLTVSPPSAATLLKKMQAAMKRAGSAHGVLTARVTQPGYDTSDTGVRDVSERTFRLHSRSTTTTAVMLNGKTTTSSVKMETVQSRRWVAARFSNDSSASVRWTCSKSKKLYPRVFALVPSVKLKWVEGPVATTTIAGTPAWDVHLVHGGKKGKLQATEDFFIAQSDHLLVRYALSATIPPPATDTAELSEQEDYSKFGETVKVHLPHACHVSRSQGKLTARFPDTHPLPSWLPALPAL